MKHPGYFRWTKPSLLRRIIGLLCLAAIFCPWIATTQEPEASPLPTPTSINKIELHQALLDLTSPWTVMCVAAHPDDEDGTTLTVLRRKHGVHTVSLFTTYGEGGQNAVGPELYEQLGVIRAHETMKASEIQGSEPHFLGLKDFGFSKSADETMRVWGRDEALRRMVMKLRELRPDVIITNHDTSRGHGHHQATGQLILEAFDAAADPRRFPEQLGQIRPWQVKRLFVRVFGSASTANTPATERVVAVDPNEVDSISGEPFAKQALRALQEHATQGPWPESVEELLRFRRIESGKLPLIRYRLIREAPASSPLPESAATLVDGLGTPESMRLPTTDDQPLTAFINQPSHVLEALIEWRSAQAGKPFFPDEAHRQQRMEERLNRALVIASGVSLTIHPSKAVLAPGTRTNFEIVVANSGDREMGIKELWFDSWGKRSRVDAAEQLLPGTETLATVETTTPRNAPFTLPKEEYLYDHHFSGRRFGALAKLRVEGALISVAAAVNLDVAPPIEIRSITPSPLVWTPSTRNHPLSFTLTVTNHQSSPFDGNFAFRSLKYDAAEVGPKLSLEPNETRELAVESTVISHTRLRRRRFLTADLGNIVISIHQPGSTEPVTARAVPMVFTNARVSAKLRVAYLPSFDQTLEKSLRTFGLAARKLSVAEIKNNDLAEYHTVLIDNRAYEAYPDLITTNSRLLEFVNAGGTLIVFYHKSNEWNPDPRRNRPQLAPYPIILGAERVTEETAPIRFLRPRHPLLNYPNRITPLDFNGWIQERGLYYPKEWDARYTALFSTNDKGEKALHGGLLVGKYGKGNYIYTSMVWYRQLRAGVRGAYRMFANMISYQR